MSEYSEQVRLSGKDQAALDVWETGAALYRCFLYRDSLTGCALATTDEGMVNISVCVGWSDAESDIDVTETEDGWMVENHRRRSTVASFATLAEALDSIRTLLTEA